MILKYQSIWTNYSYWGGEESTFPIKKAFKNNDFSNYVCCKSQGANIWKFYNLAIQNLLVCWLGFDQQYYSQMRI